MNINKEYFSYILKDLCETINNSQDKNMELKKSKIIEYINTIIDKDNCDIQEYYALAHEIRIFELLKDLNYKPIANNDSKAGPDFDSAIGYVECVTFQKPTDEKSAKILEGCLNRHLAYEPRVSQSIVEKKSKYQKYIANNVIDLKKPKIICLSPGACICDLYADTYIEICLLTLFGAGCDVVNYNVKTREFSDVMKQYTKQYNKPSNGSPINVAVFEEDDYKDISAVLLITSQLSKKYEELNLFINPNANVKIDERYFNQFITYTRSDSGVIEKINPKYKEEI